jgi:hypothetical protein
MIGQYSLQFIAFGPVPGSNFMLQCTWRSAFCDCMQVLNNAILWPNKSVHYVQNVMKASSITITVEQ